MLTESMIAELRALQKKGGGELRTEDIVDLARKPSSALHSHPAFEWDIKKAAYTQWLNAARVVVQCYVGVVKDGNESKEMRRFVSVRTIENGSVYQATERVLATNRAMLVRIVADRVLAAIRHYPLAEFDEIVQLAEELRARGQDAKVAAGEAQVAWRSGAE